MTDAEMGVRRVEAPAGETAEEADARWARMVADRRSSSAMRHIEYALDDVRKLGEWGPRAACAALVAELERQVKGLRLIRRREGWVDVDGE